MRRALLWVGVLVLALPAFARADDEVIPAGGFGQRRPRPADPCPPVQGWPVYPDVPSTTPPSTPPDLPPPVVDQLPDRFASAFATQTGQGALQGRSVNEEFDSDNAGMFYRLRTVTGTTFQRQQVGTTTQVIRNPNGVITTIITPVFANVPVTGTRTVRVPVAGRYSGVQVTENESPRPDDRVYFGYNYYDGVAATLNPNFGGFTQHRGMIGFEKTVLDGSASVGMRIPFIQLTGPAGLGGDSVGDLTVLFKYAVINDFANMNYFTLGFAVTAPTGAQGGTLADGSPIPHSVLLQPWAGFVRSGERAYLQGISNVIIPTDGRDIVLLGNSFAVGYWLYRGNLDRRLPAITPTAEAHIRTPLSNRGPGELVYFPDQVNITSGVHFRWPRAVVSGAVCVPVAGPRPWNVEAIFHLNFRF
jgi:hypothetical protein